jgi:Rrf2 family cysteine metabolism transcriptional repressor
MELARYRGNKPLQLGTIAARQGIPLKYLRQIMALVTRSGVVRTIRGAGGGYVLARPAAKIPLSELYYMLQGPMEPEKKKDEPDGVILELWNELIQSMDNVLGSKSLQDLVERQEELEHSSDSSMYHI